MPTAFFQVRLTVEQAGGGEMRLLPPDVVRSLDFQYVLVNGDGSEAIMQLVAPQQTLKEVDQDERCERLTARQMEALRASYPSPRLRKTYRVQPAVDSGAEAGRPGMQFVLDDQGNRIVDTIQTVRVDNRLIDVRVMDPPVER